MVDVVKHTSDETDVETVLGEGQPLPIELNEIGQAWKTPTADDQTLVGNVDTNQVGRSKLVPEIGDRTANAGAKVKNIGPIDNFSFSLTTAATSRTL